MSYIEIINHFWDETASDPMSPGQTALFFVVLDIHNRAGWKEWVSISNRVLMSRLPMSRKGILLARDALVDRGLIQVQERGTESTLYKVVTTQVCTQDTTQETTQDSTQGTTQDTTQNSSPLIRLDKTKKIEPKGSTKDPPEKKLVLGEHGLVRLKQTDIDRLQREMGETLLNDCIAYLDSFIAEKGYKSKDHSLAIRRWVLDAVKDKQIKQKRQQAAEAGQKKATKFCNFEQSSTDYDAIARNRLLERLRGEA